MKNNQDSINNTLYTPDKTSKVVMFDCELLPIHTIAGI